MQPNPEGNYYQFVQTPDTTVIMSEVSHDARIVRMNSMHSPAAMASPQTTVIERFTRVSDRELNYVFTISDPTYYTRAWTGETHLLRSKDRMFEVACHEGNYSMRNILEAARAQDAAAQ
jgi:hypothetical protein